MHLKLNHNKKDINNLTFMKNNTIHKQNNENTSILTLNFIILTEINTILHQKI